MKKETVKQFFQFLEKKEKKESIVPKLIFSPESLPEGLEVGGSLGLNFTSVQYLPKGLKVRGNLWLSGTPIQSLPEGLEVEGVLHLSNTSIQSLPEGLKVGGSLGLVNTPLSKNYSREEIRKMIEDRGGYVKGDIYV